MNEINEKNEGNETINIKVVDTTPPEVEAVGKCPYCGSDDLDYDTIECDEDTSGYARIPFTCNSCDKKGSEFYELTYYRTLGMSNETKEEGVCPYCGSDNVDSTSLLTSDEYDKTGMYREMHCDDCYNDYVEYHKLWFDYSEGAKLMKNRIYVEAGQDGKCLYEGYTDDLAVVFDGGASVLAIFCNEEGNDQMYLNLSKGGKQFKTTFKEVYKLLEKNT